MTHDYYITLLPNLLGIFENRLYAQTWGGAQNAPRPLLKFFYFPHYAAPPVRQPTYIHTSWKPLAPAGHCM